MLRVRLLRLHSAATAAMLSAILALVSCVPAAVADDGPPTGFPSWADVQAAKANVDAAQAEIAKISGLLASVEATAADASAKAVAAGAAYAKAAQAVKDQQKVVDALHEAAVQRAKERDASQQTAGRVATAAYAGGGPSGVFDAFSVLGQSDGLDRLGTLQILGDHAAEAVARSRTATNNANAAEAQSRQAEDSMALLSDAAKQDFDAAQAAQQHARDVVSQTQQQQNTLVAQLADLKGTSAAVEQQYEAGQAALGAYQAAQAEKQRQAEFLRQQQLGQAQAAQVVPPATWVSPGVGSGVNDPVGAQAYADSQIGGYGWGSSQFQCLLQLWTRESSWMTDATNPSSGAYGIAQALPADKYFSAGNDWLSDYRTQINWGLGYIQDRYGSPCNAWGHEVAIGWY